MKMTRFWNFAPYSLAETDRRFRSSYCLLHLSDRTDAGDSKHFWTLVNSYQTT